MMYYNIEKMFKLRGVLNPVGFLRKYGLTKSIVHKIIKKETKAFKLSSLEKVCIGLNCTPNDLIEWKPDSESQKLPPEHALHRIQPKELKDIRTILSDVAVEKLPEFFSAVEEVKERFKK